MQNKFIPTTEAHINALFIQNSNYCSDCKKRWREDAYCPHSFDNWDVWRLKKISKKIKFSEVNGKEIIEFFDEIDSIGRMPPTPMRGGGHAKR